QFDVNFFGAVEVTRAVLPAMRKARAGTIVNVSSVAGKIAIPFSAPYCSSKHALEAFSDALRLEVLPFGIRVVMVEAGPVTTNFNARARAGVARMLSSPGPYSPFYPNAERAMETDFHAGSPPPPPAASVPRRWLGSSGTPSSLRARGPATGSGKWRRSSSPFAAFSPTVPSTAG